VTDGESDYFVNQGRSRRFPWSLYHAPLERSLGAFLDLVARERTSATVLAVGCGLLVEIGRLPQSVSIVAIDIDVRAVEAVQRLGDPRVKKAVVVAPSSPVSELGQFDAIYAKEVIEHIVPWQDYLRGLHDALTPGGRLWLSTPNYGEPWLPVLEATALELIGRGMHPSRLNRGLLRRGLENAGFDDVGVDVIAWRLALVACARRRVD
jgi:2-polyprenyl-3-methyl-5-hydroxy-6-metoxy-1,4-benzoquinol methylase